MRRFSKVPGVVALAVTALVLAGCGGGSKKTAGPPPFQGVYTASGDCADSGKMTLDQCLAAMEQAVADHEKVAPTYGNLKSCEATEGRDRCERTHVGNYRPVLLAFLIVASTPPVAKPLYASGDPKKVGFRTAGNEFFLAGDEAVNMSRHAQTLAEATIDKKSKPKSPFGG